MSDEYKPGKGLPIVKLYAWVATEPDGGEGIVAGELPGVPGFTPLIGADRARIESYRAIAERVKQLSGCPVRLKMFASGTVLDEL
jgi:hypothetical protein